MVGFVLGAVLVLSLGAFGRASERQEEVISAHREKSGGATRYSKRSASIIANGIDSARTSGVVPIGMLGAIGGAALLGGVSTSIMSVILGVGAAALLYLVVEELLVEAHEERESMALSANFFLGFILIYILSSLGG